MFKKLSNSFKHSLDGLIYVYRKDLAFRQEIVLLLVGLMVIYIVDISKLEKIILFFSLFLILLIELINSAIEVTIDRISKDHHPLSKAAKDIGSAAVLLAIINAMIVWFVILF